MIVPIIDRSIRTCVTSKGRIRGSNGCDWRWRKKDRAPREAHIRCDRVKVKNVYGGVIGGLSRVDNKG